MDTQVFLIAAFGRNGQVGLNNDLPWRIPAELKHFRETTAGRPIIMGRNTAIAIEKPLPNRRNMVVSRSVDVIPSFEVAPSLKIALTRLNREPRVFIIGGPTLWEEALPLCTHLVLSQVDYDGEADANLTAPFFAQVRANYRLCVLNNREGFTVTWWMRNDLCPNPLRKQVVPSAAGRLAHD
ncbi:dihydrofolate reductase [Pseudomonas aeruginosa]